MHNAKAAVLSSKLNWNQHRSWNHISHWLYCCETSKPKSNDFLEFFQTAFDQISAALVLPTLPCYSVTNHVTLLAIIRCTHLTHVLHRITVLACYSALVLQCSPSGDWILELFILPGSLPCNTWSLLLHYLDCLLQKHIFKVGRGKKSWWNWQDEASKTQQQGESLFQRLGDDLKHWIIAADMKLSQTIRETLKHCLNLLLLWNLIRLKTIHGKLEELAVGGRGKVHTET